MAFRRNGRTRNVATDKSKLYTGGSGVIDHLEHQKHRWIGFRASRRWWVCNQVVRGGGKNSTNCFARDGGLNRTQARPVITNPSKVSIIIRTALSQIPPKLSHLNYSAHRVPSALPQKCKVYQAPAALAALHRPHVWAFIPSLNCQNIFTFVARLT